MEVSSEIGRKIKYLPARQRTCQNVQGYYVMGREITNILKIAVDYVILELCDSCDYFDSPLLIVRPITFNRDF